MSWGRSAIPESEGRSRHVTRRRSDAGRERPPNRGISLETNFFEQDTMRASQSRVRMISCCVGVINGPSPFHRRRESMETTSRGRHVLRISVFFFTLCLAPAAWAQEASIIGQVTDDTGAVLPGVTIVATSPALQVQQVGGVSNERGEYRLTPLPL